MESFGASLKRERDLRGISLEELAKATHIRPQYIEAIEHDHLEKLPGLTFLKGYVRSYADYVGLNLDEVMLKLDPLIAAMQAPAERTPFSRFHKWGFWAGILLFLVGLILIAKSC